MNKESYNNSRQPRTKIKSLNDSSLKHFFKSISPKTKAINSASNSNSNRIRDNDKEKNKENERINTPRGKPPISRATNSKCASVLKVIPKDNAKRKDNNKVPHSNHHRNKNDSNSSRPLTAEITLSSSCITENNNNTQKRTTSLWNTSNTINKSSLVYIKLQDEANDLKLINSKLKNDISILNNSLASLKQDILIKTNEKEEVQKKYNKMLLDLQEELNQLKSTHVPLSSIPKSSTTQHENVIKSLVSILIEICEMFIAKSIIRNSSTIQIETSVDVFESYNNNDEERSSSLFEQIQNILISKIGNIKRTLTISLNKEIERIQNWSPNINQSINLNIFSPLKHKTTKTNEDILNSLSKMYMNSNSTLNDFDLSVSGNFYAQSPKFNSFDGEGGSRSGSLSHRNSNHISNSNISHFINSNQKILQKSPEIEHLMSNDSLLEDITNANGVSGNENKENGISKRQIQDERKENNQFEDSNNKVNVLDCSIGDLVSPTNPINVTGHLTANKELKENMSNFTLDDVENNDILGGHC